MRFLLFLWGMPFALYVVNTYALGISADTGTPLLAAVPGLWLLAAFPLTAVYIVARVWHRARRDTEPS